MIDRGVHIIICLWMKKIFESYFRDRLNFSNIDSRTSRRIYRLLYYCALQKRSPQSRFSIFNAHLTLLVRRMTSHTVKNGVLRYTLICVVEEVLFQHPCLAPIFSRKIVVGRMLT